MNWFLEVILLRPQNEISSQASDFICYKNWMTLSITSFEMFGIYLTRHNLVFNTKYFVQSNWFCFLYYLLFRFWQKFSNGQSDINQYSSTYVAIIREKRDLQISIIQYFKNLTISDDFKISLNFVWYFNSIWPVKKVEIINYWNAELYN